MSYDPSHNEFLMASYMNKTNTISFMFRNGDTIEEVKSPRERELTLEGKNQTGPIKSIQKMN
jgi:hypothetical protein